MTSKSNNSQTPEEMATIALGCDVRGLAEWHGAFAILVGPHGAKVMVSRATLDCRRVCAARISNLLRLRARTEIDHAADDLWERAVGMFMEELGGETGETGGIEND